MTRIITIANQKGGVGKTTTTIELAENLAKYFDKRVLMIDLDPQASLTGIRYDARKASQSVNMTSIMMTRSDMSEGIVNLKKNLDLVPTTIDLSDTEITIVGVISREFILKQAIEEIADNYDYILIDCPPSRGVLTVNALVASTDVLIPVQAEYQAVVGSQLLKKTIKVIQDGVNDDLNVLGFIATMTTHTNHSNEIIDILGQDDYKIIAEIPRSIDVADATVSNVSTYEYRKSNAAGKAYHELTKLIVGEE